MSFRVRSNFILLALLFFFAPHFSFAQPLPERVTFRGSVVDDAGKPLANAEVMLRRRIQAGVAFWGAAIKTDAKGEFEFPNIEAGTYSVSVSASGTLNNRGGLQGNRRGMIVRNGIARGMNGRVIRPLFAPGGVVPQGAVPQGVAGSDTTPILNQLLEIRADDAPAKFRLMRAGTLRAALKTANDAPVAGHWVSLYLEPVGENATANIRRLERVAVGAGQILQLGGIVPGRYDAIAWVEGVGYIEQKDLEVVPGMTPVPLVWQVKPGGTLRISAQNAAGKAMGGAQMTLVRVDGAETTPQRRWESQIYRNVDGAVTRDGDGTLEVAGLAPGRYRAALVNDLYVIGNGRPAGRRQVVDIEEGKTTEISFTVEMENAASLALQIVDAKGAPRGAQSFLVVLKDAAPNSAATLGQNAVAVDLLERRLQTDIGGFATLFPLAPGTYQVAALLENTSLSTRPMLWKKGVAATGEAGSATAPLVLTVR